MRYVASIALFAICLCSHATAEQAPANTSAWPTGEFVELLPTVNVHRARLGGEVTRTGDGLVLAPRPHSWGRVLLPVKINGDYELHVRFTVYASDGHKGMQVIIPIGDHRCLIVLNGWRGKITGLGSIDNQLANNNATTLHGDIFPKPRQYVAIIKVQSDGDDASIHVRAAGRDVIDWSGKLSSLDLEGRLPNVASPQLGDDASTVVVHSAQLKLLSGTAAWSDPPILEKQTTATTQISAHITSGTADQ